LAEAVDVLPMRPHARPRRTVAALVLVATVAGGALAVVTAVGPAAAAADSSPPNTTSSADADAAAAYGALALQLNRNQAMLAQVSAQLDDTTQQLAQLVAAVADTQQKLDATRAESARLQGIVRERAAVIYTSAHQPQLAVGDIERVEDLSAGRQYAQAATHTDARRIGDLNRQADALDAKLQDLQHQRDQQQQEQDRLANAKAALETLTARQKQVLDQAGAVPVMGAAQLTVDDVAAWFAARGARYRLAGDTTMKDLIEMYFEEGAAEHVRPELAFAQSVLETGSFGHALDNNYGGIGACDSCDGEIAFPTPRDGVRGQMQLLRNFADPTSRAAGLAYPPSPQIFGRDPAAAAASFDTYVAKGRIPTWNLMGNGNWATDPTYASKVLVIYFDMVTFAARRN
jgi:peptidoglycan hydrolase CwlO-like protein